VFEDDDVVRDVVAAFARQAEPSLALVLAVMPAQVLLQLLLEKSEPALSNFLLL
jgi:hypothetical protein